ncbi:MAG TPA: glycosyltransferase, partial [Anaerolineae bacterium]
MTSVSESATPSVVIYTSDRWDSACPAVRLTGPLEAAGFKVLRGNTNDEVDATLVDTAHYVVIQRDFPRLAQAYDRIIAKAHAAHKPIIYELDDLLFDTPIEHPAHNLPQYRAARPAVLRALLDADLVTVSTNALYKEIVPLNPNTHLLPNFLNERLWPQAQKRHEFARKPVVIGYVAGGTHQPDLEAVTPALTEVLRRYGSDVRLHVHIPIPAGRLADLPNVEWNSDYIPSYAEFASYVSGLEFDVVIAPLLDSQFNRCKSNLKYLENECTGGAGVYSRETPFESIVRQGENGMLASTKEEWVDALSQLIESAELRSRIAANARTTVQSEWLLSQNAWRWKEVYVQAVPRSPDAVNTSSVQLVVQRLSRLHDVLQAELEQVEQHVGAMSDTQYQAKQQLDESRASLAQMEVSNRELRSHVLNLTIVHDAAQSLVAAQREESRALEARVSARQLEIDRLAEINRELATSVAELRSVARTLTGTLAARQSEIHELEAIIDTQRLNIKALNARAGQLVRSKVYTRQWANQVSMRNEELNASLDKSERQNQAQAERWQALTQTVTWRAMQPVWHVLHKVAPPGSRRNHVMGSIAWWLTYLGEHGPRALVTRTALGAARTMNRFPAARALARHSLPHSIQARIQRGITPVTLQVTSQPATAPMTSAVELNPFTALTQSSRMLSKRCFNVLYITIDPKLVSHQVRVTNYQEYLRQSNIATDFIDAGDVVNHMAEIPRYDIVVIFRAVYNEPIRRVYEVCRQAGVPVVYDIDDYIFDARVMTPRYVDGLRFLSED